MRITGPQRSSETSAGNGVKKASSGSGFVLPDAGGSLPASQAGGASAARGLADVSSLLALQMVETPDPAKQRKGRMVRRGRQLLETLDEIKVAMIDGHVSPLHLTKLQLAIEMARENTEDPGLEAVLDAVELRARVELAKLQQAAT